MYCSKCGTPRADDAKFCAGCGTQFDEVMNVQPEPEQETAEEIQGTETLENSDASRSESESLSAEDDVADEETIEDVEPDDQEMPIPAENDVADEGTMEDIEPDDQEVPAQAESGDSVKVGSDGSSWIEESNSTAQNKGISKPMLIGVSVVIVAVALILVISSPGDQGGGISKEELVQQIRNGERGDFTGVDLSGSDLSGLQNMELFGTDFSGADLSLVDFTDSDLSYADFTGATLSNAKFVNSNLVGATFSGSYSGLHIRNSNLTSSSFSGELSSFTFENVDLTWASLRMVTFGDNVRFIDSTLVATDFTCFKIEGDVRFFTNWISTSMNPHNLLCDQDDAVWTDTIFNGNTFFYANLEWGNFDGTSFLCNSFIGSNIGNNDFTNTQFITVQSVYHPTLGYQGTEVCEQTFTDSLLRYSTFGGFGEGTSFVGSSLEDSTVSSVSEEVTWSDTICPDGTNSDDNENTCENNL